jgi:hypothetical protein
MVRFKALAAAAALLLVEAPTETRADSCSLINSAYSSCQLSTMCSRCVATSVGLSPPSWYILLHASS